MKFKEIECISFRYYFIVPQIRYAIQLEFCAGNKYAIRVYYQLAVSLQLIKELPCLYSP